MPTFRHGRDLKVYLNAYDWTAFFNQSSQAGSCQAVDVSTFGTFDRAYIAGLVDARTRLQGFMSAGTADPDQVLDGLLGGTALAVCSMFPFTDAPGSPGWVTRGVLTSKAIDATAQGAVGHQIEIQSCVGWEEVVSLKALGLQTGAGTVPAVDLGAAGSVGAAFYVQATNGTISGTAGTVTVESSSTQGGAYVAHGTVVFPTQAVPGTVPGGLGFGYVDIPVGVVVNRWVRVNPTTWGTASLHASIRRS